MRKHIPLISDKELTRRAKPRKKATFDDVERLRYPRAMTAHVLGRSIATIQRMEKRGQLTVLRDSEKGAVFHPAGQVRALAGGER